MIIQLKINVKVREELGMVTRNNKSVWATFDSCGMDSELKRGKGLQYSPPLPIPAVVL